MGPTDIVLSKKNPGFLLVRVTVSRAIRFCIVHDAGLYPACLMSHESFHRFGTGYDCRRTYCSLPSGFHLESKLNCVIPARGLSSTNTPYGEPSIYIIIGLGVADTLRDHN
jgi:hypothetical protein